LDRGQNYNAGQSRGYNDRGEPFEVMLRKFFREVQQSGILTEIKKRRFRSKELTREQIRESARRKATRRKIKRGY